MKTTTTLFVDHFLLPYWYGFERGRLGKIVGVGGENEGGTDGDQGVTAAACVGHDAARGIAGTIHAVYCSVARDGETVQCSS